MIRYYTREAVCVLEREISKFVVKLSKEVLLHTKETKARIEPDDLEHYLVSDASVMIWLTTRPNWSG